MAVATQNPVLEAQRAQLEAQYRADAQDRYHQAQSETMLADAEARSLQKNGMAQAAFLGGVGVAGGTALYKGIKTAQAYSPEYQARQAAKLIEQGATGTSRKFLRWGGNPTFDASKVAEQAQEQFGEKGKKLVDIVTDKVGAIDRAGGGTAEGGKAAFERINKAVAGKYEKAFKNNDKVMEAAQEVAKGKAGGKAQKIAGTMTEYWGNMSGHSKAGTIALATLATAGLMYGGKKLIVDKYFDPAEKREARSQAEANLRSARINESNWRAAVASGRSPMEQGNAVGFIESERAAAMNPEMAL